MSIYRTPDGLFLAAVKLVNEPLCLQTKRTKQRKNKTNTWTASMQGSTTDIYRRIDHCKKDNINERQTAWYKNLKQNQYHFEGDLFSFHFDNESENM